MATVHHCNSHCPKGGGLVPYPAGMAADRRHWRGLEPPEVQCIPWVYPCMLNHNRKCSTDICANQRTDYYLWDVIQELRTNHGMGVLKEEQLFDFGGFAAGHGWMLGDALVCSVS